MKSLLLVIISTLLLTTVAFAQQIKVSPTSVNVNSQGATTVFLTYGGLKNYRAAEACMCSELISITTCIGPIGESGQCNFILVTFKCNPATSFGCLPARYDLSTRSGNEGFTDIMTIPPSVARRAYQDAAAGRGSSFFYVRRFISTVGGPDQFIPVACRLTGGGAGTPFALTDVKLSFDIDKPVVLVKTGERIPPAKAEIAYNGTGRLKGRWEVVLPGEELPSERDLLTEATLPIEERPRQRRYTELSRFNVFLPPTGKYILSGPDPSRLPNRVEGPYLLILRIEAADDREGESDLRAVGAGPGVVHSGAVAGFPMPPLRYFVGSGQAGGQSPAVTMLLPAGNAIHPLSKILEFSWTEIEQASAYRLETEDAQGRSLLSAILLPGAAKYGAPSWLGERAGEGGLRWRVIALDQTGNQIADSSWRSLRFAR